MYRSAYLVYTKLLQVYNYPFSEWNKKGIRKSFEPLFGESFNEHNYFLSYENVNYDIYHHTDKYNPRYIFKLKYGRSRPFIKNIGQVKFRIPFLESNDPHHYFNDCEVIGKINDRPIWENNTRSYQGKFDDNIYKKSRFCHDSDDQRFTLLSYSLENPLYISAYDGARCVATGRIFVNIYSCGFVALSVAISLQDDAISMEDIFPVIEHLSPADKHSSVPWVWKSKIRNGSLCDIVNNVISLLSDSIFETGTFVNVSKKWHTSIKIHSDEMPECFVNALDLEKSRIVNKIKYYKIETCRWRHTYAPEDMRKRMDYRTREKKEKNKLNYILFSDNLDIHNYASIVRPNYALHRFWRNHDLLERTLIKNAILESYTIFYADEYENLKLWRLSKFEQFKEDKFFNLTAFSPNIYKHISYLKKDAGKLSPFYRKLFSEYSESVGLNKTFDKINILKVKWEEECLNYESLGMAWVKKTRNFILGFFGISI